MGWLLGRRELAGMKKAARFLAAGGRFGWV